jgi:hypothetical protein
MCGIAGYFLRRRDADPADVRAMCARIVHRGPDDEGIYTEGGCGIGMRRLSIIDLAGGHQPIGNEDGTLQVVFNGEIYNYKELRGLLQSRGHRFSTDSDTETIVHLYEDEGPQGIQRLRGMFGIALWDSRRQRLLLAGRAVLRQRIEEFARVPHPILGGRGGAAPVSAIRLCAGPIEHLFRSPQTAARRVDDLRRQRRDG